MLLLYKINGGCERYSFISGLDEMALPSEIGLYFDFNVTNDGIPFGCPGLEKFDSVHFNMSKTLYYEILSWMCIHYRLK